MLNANDSNNQPFAKTAGYFAEARFARPMTETDEKNFWLCGDETPDLHKDSPGTEGVISYHWKMTRIN